MTEASAEIGSFQRNDEPSEAKREINNFVSDMGGSAVTAPAERHEPEIDKIKQTLESEIDRIDHDPAATYIDRLKAVGVTTAEAAGIVDDLLSKGYYERTFSLTKKHTVTLRTRDVGDQERMQNVIEDATPQYAISINETVSKYNLAASLAVFRGRKFRDEEFRETLRYVEKLPLAVFTALVNRLAKFDAIMNVVLSEGVVENF